MDQIPTFINRKNNKAPVTYIHEDLKPILKDTYGVLVYQEQIMKIAHEIAGFSLGEADLLRRRSEEHTSELQSRGHLVCRLLLEKKKNDVKTTNGNVTDILVPN